eukprot:CAMPEP_0176401522 /NCGR_PEP_ID=MMETSP0126-20121128/48501_1 /TAXON_ID=141414 ORGANISM="Strombidinopsis acuminatum, Strain SPMC142" /NCGR_SAMPLE_ID=MMETSP0126 /ASSEMBLY_ACC=CAM_ASM_000229 /LENGTH=66 /DNA_ID=CAMNT_0017778501 /DNA_START=48 /DNA_END=248 /DNA_ORIENTATION=-
MAIRVATSICDDPYTWEPPTQFEEFIEEVQEFFENASGEDWLLIGLIIAGIVGFIYKSHKDVEKHL